MDNGERSRRLMAMAAECLQDMDAACSRKSWNAVVRRAQEVVELALKGVLSYLAVDFPKVSAAPARERAPVFYFEQIEDEPTAGEAAADARRIHGICARLVAAIQSEPPEPNECAPEPTSSDGGPPKDGEGG